MSFQNGSWHYIFGILPYGRNRKHKSNKEATQRSNFEGYGTLSFVLLQVHQTAKAEEPLRPLKKGHLLILRQKPSQV